MKRWIAALLLAGLAWCGAATAQQLEIITLKYRSAEQLMPQLRPLLAQGAALTGTGNKLFLRTSAPNLADLRRVLDELDREPRRLMISVRQGGQLQQDGRGAELAADVALGKNVRIVSAGHGNGAGATVDIRRNADSLRGNAYAAHSNDSEQIDQQVQTIEGGRAWINVGQSLPLPLRQTVTTPHGVVATESVGYRDVGSGFYAEPLLSDDRVTLEISPTHDTPGSQPGSVNIQRLGTRISGRLGEWLELGGSDRESVSDRTAGLSYSSRSARDERRVWLKVDALP